MLGSSTKIGEPGVVFASKNIALVSQPHVVVAPISVADITTGHDHLTTTPLSTLTAVSSTLTPPPPDSGDLWSWGLYYSAYQCQTCILANSHRILSTARALLLGTSVPKRLWMDAVTYAVYLLNRLPSRVLDFQTPMHVLTHHISASSMLTLSPKVFGCVVYVHLHQNQRSKMDPCALCCVFLGFSSHQKGYRCYHPATRHLYVSMDVTFIEDEMFFSDTPEHVLQWETSSEGHNWLDLQGGVVLDSLIQREEPTEAAEPATPAEPATLAEPAILTDVITVTELIAPHDASLIVPDQTPLDIPEVSASTHTSDNSYILPPRWNYGVPPDHYSPKGKARYAIAHYVSDHRLVPECKAFVTRMDNIKIPTHVKEAFNDPKWAEAMNIEMEALQK
ncbi:unnamed protein product, partial [Prunus brigantina]